MRACVFGAGAVGGHLAAIRKNGIALREGAHAGARTIAGRVHASGRPADPGVQDIVFVTTKARALAALEKNAAQFLAGPRTMFVFVQNGILWWNSQGLATTRPPDLSRLDPVGAIARAASVPVPKLEALTAVTARLAARKGLYSPP